MYNLKLIVNGEIKKIDCFSIEKKVCMEGYDQILYLYQG